MTGNAPRHESQAAYHRRRMSDLSTVRQPWEGAWQTMADFMEPTRLRRDLLNEGSTSRRHILDCTGTLALRMLKSGMHSGITSPARPWFRLRTSDPGMRDYAPVKEYLSDVEGILRDLFGGSNIYQSFHSGYGDLGQFGQSCGLLVEDDQKVIRMMQFLHGQFWIGRDEHGVATTLYRKFRWSVQRIVARFGYQNVPDRVRTLYDSSKYDERFDLHHAVEPRMERDHRKLDKRNKPYLSNYWMDGCGDNDSLLEESGFDSNPIIAPPWELAGDDNYSVSPGMVAAGDVKMLQREQTRKLEGIDKKVRPPMTGPTSLRNNPASLLPGSITYVDDPTGKGYRPAMEVQIQLAELNADIRDVQQRIDRAMYADLWMMLSQMEGVQPRNIMELAERKEEKLLQLGPVLENIYGGQLEPVIDRTFQIAAARGLLPPAPAELQNQDLEIEYISMLAQAQKAVSTGGIERLWGFVGQVAAMRPEVLDKLDADETIDQYADALGVSPKVVVPDDEVEKIRAAREQQQRAAQMTEAAAALAPAAKSGAEAAAVLADAQNNASGPALLQQLGLQ